jgi:UDPglucose 6-dehydrogenase
VTFVVVPTPSEGDGSFSLRFAAGAFTDIGQALAEKDEYHLVVLTSTVLPGSTRYGLLPLLESASRKTCGDQFGLCYSPEFIALGSVIRDFLNPDFTLIGEHDAEAGARLERCYADLLENGSSTVRMSLENAELAKISVNTFVTMKISFANMLAGLCERMPGGDVDAVTAALSLDRRIGGEYLTGAMPYGGPCFPRDNAALSFFARAVRMEAHLAESANSANRAWADHVLQHVRSHLRPHMSVAVLGLAYKPQCYVVEQSPGLMLATALSEDGIRVHTHDPLAGDSAKARLNGRVTYAPSVRECVRAADIVVVTMPDVAYLDLSASDFRACPPVTVVDCWRCLEKRLAGAPNVHYVSVGRGTDHAGYAANLRALWAPHADAGVS